MKNANCLLIKTSAEIALKSNPVRNHFTKKLVTNIKLSLKANQVDYEKISRGGGRLYLFSPQLEKAAAVLQKVIGVHAIAFSFQGNWKNLEEIEQQILQHAKAYFKKGDSFALHARRTAKTNFTSKDLENKIGQKIMDSIQGLKVDLSKPKKEIFIEVRKKDFFIFFEEISCIRGLPVGVEGSAAFLFQGKENEGLAAFLMLFRGCNIFPVVQKPSKKIEKILQKLTPFNAFRGFIVTELKDLPALIEERQLQAIATGDSSLTKASLKSYAEFDSKQSIAVLRPLLLYPKQLLNEKRGFFES